MDTQNIINWTFTMSRGASNIPYFSHDWLIGNSWNISKKPQTLEEYHNKPPIKIQEVYQKTVSQAINNQTTGIVERMDGQRKERTQARQKINEPANLDWKTVPLPEWVQHPGAKFHPVRIMIPDNQHTFLRSLAWVLDSSFRYQSATDWNIARMDWLKQIAQDLEKHYYEKYKDQASVLTLQQHLMRSAFDWDEMIMDSMKTGKLKPILEILMDWCECQFWVWKEETKEMHLLHGRKWADHPEHCAALPVVVFWRDESRFQPVVWLDGVPANPEAETIRPLPRIWLEGWQKLWSNSQIEMAPPSPPPSPPPSVKEETTQEETTEEDSRENTSQEYSQDEDQDKIVIGKELKRDSKPFWQAVMRKMNLSEKKRSDKTGKLVDKTIDDMREEARQHGIILANIVSK